MICAAALAVLLLASRQAEPVVRSYWSAPQRAELGDRASWVLVVQHPDSMTLDWLAPPEVDSQLAQVLAFARWPAEPVGPGWRRDSLLVVVLLLAADTVVQPSWRLALRASSGWSGSLTVAAPPLRVLSALPDTMRDLADLKSASMAAPEARWPAYILLGLVLLWALFVIHKGRVQLYFGEPGVYRARLRAQERLRRLLWTEGSDPGAFIEELVDTLRDLLAEEAGLPARERTSSELLALARERGWPESALSLLRQLLEKADLVKFARYPASAEQAQRAREAALGLLGMLLGPEARRR
ncbi:MAG: hypothetical protein N2561_07085 [Bacteroidetes bacterium]|nr:hypothetical protein [Rhodothermia bacterium]MCS7155000.1 hypothetical protein [Bacteroidota bacterium]MCX7907284.1 hypothetical protein [Bacteroidota bacterium]MDW8137990.1 hypothetical protein [Bacteroidota bacterium]MDW8286158.1 hypothetical protein [Bacteroidota bacterium]